MATWWCLIHGVAIGLATAGVGDLHDMVRVLGEWQHDTAAMQLHPGDLGWCWRSGAEATAAAIRTWTRDRQLVAIGFLDGPTVLRLTVAPEVLRDEPVAHRLVTDLADAVRGVLPAGEVAVEAPNGSLIQELLDDAGWPVGESWTPLSHDLAGPVPDPGIRVEVVGPELAASYTAVHRASFDSPRLTAERWQVMTSGAPFRQARSLLGYDDSGVAVAEATVWSAGPGRPGLLEPLGVHPDHRGRGFGRAIALASAAALRELGASSALVCTRTANSPAVATYESAGYRVLPERLDRTRAAA